MEDLHNARRQRVLRRHVGRGGCFGKELLDACDQVGWELPEAHQQVEIEAVVMLLFGVFPKLCKSNKCAHNNLLRINMWWPKLRS